ncbi:MAG: hypothetical protein ACE5JI_09115 [Acidobacteriota bacterium]
METNLVASEAAALPQANGLSRTTIITFGVGIAGLVASYLLGRPESDQFWQSYLVSSLFFLSLGLGGLFFVLLQFVTRAGWSVVVRRQAEHVMGTVPLLALLFLPLGTALTALYPWAGSDASTVDRLLLHRRPYLNVDFFSLRSLAYLLGWSALAWWFRRQSLRQDDTQDIAITRRLQTASAPAMLFFGLTVTFASFDWIMALDPHWYSTILGVYFFAGSAVAILAFLIIEVLWLQTAGLLLNIVSYEHFHDLGKLLFGFVAFWAYIAFSQFMLIWYGNIPEETSWYAHRLQHGWTTVSWGLAVGHFVLPFFFLLPRDVKRKRATLLIGAFWLLAMHYLDLYWLVMPNFHLDGFAPHLLDITTLAGVGGVFLGTLTVLLRRSALVPLGDPRLLESLSFENT